MHSDMNERQDQTFESGQQHSRLTVTDTLIYFIR